MVAKAAKSRADTPASPQSRQVHLNQSAYSVWLGMAFLIGYRCSQSRLYIKNVKLIPLRHSTLHRSSQDNTSLSHQQNYSSFFEDAGSREKKHRKQSCVMTFFFFLAPNIAGRPKQILVIKFNV